MKKSIIIASAGIVSVAIALALAQDPPKPDQDSEQTAAVAAKSVASQPAGQKKDYGIIVQPTDKPVRIETTAAGELVIAVEDQPVQIQASSSGGMISVDLFKLKQFRSRPVASTMVALSYMAAGYGAYQYADKQGWIGSDNDDDQPKPPPAPQTVNGDYYYIAGSENISIVQSVNNGESQTVSAGQSDQGGE